MVGTAAVGRLSIPVACHHQRNGLVPRQALSSDSVPRPPVRRGWLGGNSFVEGSYRVDIRHPWGARFLTVQRLSAKPSFAGRRAERRGGVVGIRAAPRRFENF
jgi:hypothetical protein